MVNPTQAMFDDTREIIAFVLFIIMIIIILVAIGVVFGMPEFINNLINSISFGILIILAIPPIGLIVGIIILVVKKYQGEVSL